MMIMIFYIVASQITFPHFPAYFCKIIKLPIFNQNKFKIIEILILVTNSPFDLEKIKKVLLLYSYEIYLRNKDIHVYFSKKQHQH